MGLRFLQGLWCFPASVNVGHILIINVIIHLVKNENSFQSSQFYSVQSQCLLDLMSNYRARISIIITVILEDTKRVRRSITYCIVAEVHCMRNPARSSHSG